LPKCRAAPPINCTSLVEHSPGRFAGHGERLGQQVVEAFAGFVTLLELVGLGAQLGVGQLLDVVGQAVHMVRDPLEALDHAAFTETEQLRQHANFPCGLDGTHGLSKFHGR
jgi:hypothetical protein